MIRCFFSVNIYLPFTFAFFFYPLRTPPHIPWPQSIRNLALFFMHINIFLLNFIVANNYKRHWCVFFLLNVPSPPPIGQFGFLSEKVNHLNPTRLRD